MGCVIRSTQKLKYARAQVKEIQNTMSIADESLNKIIAALKQ